MDQKLPGLKTDLQEQPLVQVGDLKHAVHVAKQLIVFHLQLRGERLLEMQMHGDRPFHGLPCRGGQQPMSTLLFGRQDHSQHFNTQGLTGLLPFQDNESLRNSGLVDLRLVGHDIIPGSTMRDLNSDRSSTLSHMLPRALPGGRSIWIDTQFSSLDAAVSHFTSPSLPFLPSQIGPDFGSTSQRSFSDASPGWTVPNHIQDQSPLLYRQQKKPQQRQQLQRSLFAPSTLEIGASQRFAPSHVPVAATAFNHPSRVLVNPPYPSVPQASTLDFTLYNRTTGGGVTRLATLPRALPSTLTTAGSTPIVKQHTVSFPIILAHPSDSYFLSSHQIYLRQQIEVFCATNADVKTRVKGRNKFIYEGQFGIRCRHCAHLPIPQRQMGSMYFPISLLGFYQAAQNMCCMHLQCGKCSQLTDEVKSEFVRLLESKNETSIVGSKYWAEQLGRLGLVDTDKGVFEQENVPVSTLVVPMGSLARPKMKNHRATARFKQNRAKVVPKIDTSLLTQRTLPCTEHK